MRDRVETRRGCRTYRHSVEAPGDGSRTSSVSLERLRRAVIRPLAGATLGIAAFDGSADEREDRSALRRANPVAHRQVRSKAARSNARLSRDDADRLARMLVRRRSHVTGSFRLLDVSGEDASSGSYGLSPRFGWRIDRRRSLRDAPPANRMRRQRLRPDRLHSQRAQAIEKCSRVNVADWSHGGTISDPGFEPGDRLIRRATARKCASLRGF